VRPTLEELGAGTSVCCDDAVVALEREEEGDNAVGDVSCCVLTFEFAAAVVVAVVLVLLVVGA
jgi:hypothetical protein